MSDRRRKFYVNGITLAILALFTRSVALFFNSYVSKQIGAEGMGLFELCMIVYSFAVTFATSGISLTVTRLTSSAIGENKEDELSRILRASVLYSLIFSGVATLALYFVSPYFSRVVLEDARTVAPLRVLSFSLIPLSLSSALSGYFVGIRRVQRNAIFSVACQIFRVVFTIFLLSKKENINAESGAYIISLVMTLTEILVLFFSILQYLRYRNKNRTGKEKHFRSVSQMALPLATSAYVRSALLTLEHSLIPQKLRESGSSHQDALSSYGVLHGMALPLVLFPMSPLSSFSGLLVPEFSESLAMGDKKRLERIASEALNTSLKYAVFIMCVMLLFSEELGYSVYSSFAAGRYIAFLAPVIPIMYIDHVTDAILKGIGEHIYSMWVNISDSVLSILLVMVLIPRIGIVGYAVVILVMELYNFSLSVIRLRKKIFFRIDFLNSLIIPLIFGVFASLFTRKLFAPTSANTSPLWLYLEIVFLASVILGLELIMKSIRQIRSK